jgi:hypothetical protein
MQVWKTIGTPSNSRSRPTIRSIALFIELVLLPQTGSLTGCVEPSPAAAAVLGANAGLGSKRVVQKSTGYRILG